MNDKPDEFAYIDWIRARTAMHPRVPIGIGDDAAAIRFPAPADCLVAADMLMEDVHFRLSEHSPREVGRKALAVNLSDIAAMAGRPIAAFVTVALPKQYGVGLARELHDGIAELATEFDLIVAGGDTNVWDGPLVVSVTVVGEGGPRGIVRRSGAKPGDVIFVTGTLGGSLAGKHMQFTPRLVEAAKLQETAELHAMIDVSDGLAADLHHILEDSSVGAEIIADSIPISEAARSIADARSPLEHALGDGEDFELIFTVASNDSERIATLDLPGCPITRIGSITSGRICELIQSNGTRLPLPPTGWSHSF